MKPAIRRIVVLRLAERIHRPLSHGSVDPVVGQGEDDAVARSAVCAIDVGISVASIGRVEAFFQAFFADGQIRRDADSGPLRAMTLSNGELVQTLAGCGFDLNSGDRRGGGRLAPHLSNERLHVLLRAFNVNFDSLVAVKYPTS